MEPKHNDQEDWFGEKKYLSSFFFSVQHGLTFWTSNMVQLHLERIATTEDIPIASWQTIVPKFEKRHTVTNWIYGEEIDNSFQSCKIVDTRPLNLEEALRGTVKCNNKW